MTAEDAKNLETQLKKECYKKYNQKHLDSHYQYWKSFDGYQCGFLFYDFSEYSQIIFDFAVSFTCLLDCEKRVELISTYEGEPVEKFHEMGKDFYKSMKKYA